MADQDWLMQLLASEFAAREAQRQQQAAQQAALQAQINDPNSEYNRRLRAAERAAAEQNEFTRGITNRQTATGEYNSRTDRAYREALVKQAAEDLAFKYAQLAQSNELERGKLGLSTLQLGASLHGPRDWDSYLETAAQAGQNPILNRAMSTWSSLTGVRPNTGAVNGPMPQRFDLNALASDFGMGGGGAGRELPRDANLDAVAMGTAPDPGWWQSLSPDERQRAQGYWETHGWSPDDVLSRLSYTAANQGLSYGGA